MIFLMLKKIVLGFCFLALRSSMDRGIVKLFDNKRGFGFITCQGEDLFVHYSDIQADGYNMLYPNQKVEFIRIDAPRGPQAIKVRLIDD